MIDVPDDHDFVEEYFRQQARRKLARFLSRAKLWLYLGFAAGLVLGGTVWIALRLLGLLSPLG